MTVPSLAGGVGFEVGTAGVVEDHGPAEALRVVELEEAGGHVPPSPNGS